MRFTDMHANAPEHISIIFRESVVDLSDSVLRSAWTLEYPAYEHSRCGIPIVRS